MTSRIHFVCLSIALTVASGSLTNCGTSAEVTASRGQDCSGMCTPPVPSGWQGPALLWTGPEDDAPACPDYAPDILYTGDADLIAPDGCAACTCEPPSGACALPTKITGYLSETACMPSPNVFSLDPPPNWDGSCVANNSIPPDTINTFVMGPLHLTESGCSPGATVPPVTAPPPSWATYAVACSGDGLQCKNGDFCFQTAEPIPAGFSLCILHEGMEECPEAYPSQRVFYDGADDERACVPCDCGPPIGSDCMAYVVAFESDTCTGWYTGGQMHLSPVTVCHLGGPYPDPFPWRYGSKSAGPPMYTPGACAPNGGEPIGAVTPTGPRTACCRD